MAHLIEVAPFRPFGSLDPPHRCFFYDLVVLLGSEDSKPVGEFASWYMGVSLNGGIPETPQVMIIFNRENPWLLGTTILGNPHIVNAYPTELRNERYFFVGNMRKVEQKKPSINGFWGLELRALFPPCPNHLKIGPKNIGPNLVFWPKTPKLRSFEGNPRISGNHTVTHTPAIQCFQSKNNWIDGSFGV